MAISGKDGFECLLPNKVIVTEDEGAPISVLVQNHFASIDHVRKFGTEAKMHRQSLLLYSRREGIARQFLKKIGKGLRSLRNIRCHGGLKQIHLSVADCELDCLDIAPSIEGRIEVATEEHINRFEREKNLHRYVRSRLSPKERFSKEQMEEIKTNFKLFDTNMDGLICKTELSKALEKQGAILSEADIDRIFREVDTNESGGIDMEEFIKLMAANFEITDCELLDAFHAFDDDNNGVLNEDEIFTVMRSLGMWLNKVQVKQMMADSDKDKSGDISYEELVQYMRNM